MPALSANANDWPVSRRMIAHHQTTMAGKGLSVGEIDGLIGPQTEYALSEWEGGKSSWRSHTGELPDDDHEAQMIAAYGAPGGSQKQFELPYPMVLAWDTSQTVNRITLHEKVGDSAIAAYTEALSRYGFSQLEAMGLTLYGGSLNVRKKRGGNAWSTHAWGVAIDMNPAENQIRWDHTKARFAGDHYELWWEAWESRGWFSLGRSLDFDWMHIQKAKP